MITTVTKAEESRLGVLTRGHPTAISICIVSHNAYGAIKGGRSGFIGGVERQTSMLARWLAKRGHNVSLLTWNEGGPPEEVVDGVRVVTICPPRAGLPGMRFFHPKWTGLNKALRRANADLYYHNCGENVTGQVGLWCRQRGRAFVFSTASDYDCDARLPELRLWRDRWLYRYGLRAANRIIVQTKTQRSMMRRNFALDSVLIPLPCTGPDVGAKSRSKAVSNRVLWAGRLCAQKRPDKLMEIAKAIPDLHFDMVGPNSGDRCAQSALALANNLSNVRVLGRIPPHAMPSFYENAACLLCTSDYEGFPNTFLEAWNHALPVISTIDPDGLIARNRLGAIASDSQGLSNAIGQLINFPSDYEQISRNALCYYREIHAAERVLPQFERLFVDAANSSGRGRRPFSANK